MWGHSAACRSKANKQIRLVERKVGFISDASNWGQEEGTTEDKMVGWHHRLDGHGFEQALGDGDAVQPSHPLSSPSPPAFNLSQHQVAKIIGVSTSASVLPMNTQDWSPLGWSGWISLQSKGLERVFSSTTVQKHQFFGAQLSSQSNSHIHT